MDYISMPGWNTSIAGITSYDQLPANARAYVERLGELVGIPSESSYVSLFSSSSCGFVVSLFLQFSGLELGLGELT